MSPREHTRAAAAVSAILLLLYAYASLAGPRALWGLNFAKFLPRWWAILSVAIGAAFLLPSFSRQIVSLLERVSHRLDESARLRLRAGAVVAIGITVLGLIFHVRSYFLGDGTLRLNQLVSGRIWLPTEAGDFFLHAMVARALSAMLRLSSGAASVWSYHILSAAAGALFVVGIYRLARYLQSTQALLLTLLFGSTGLMALFFGYVESYSLVAALLPWLVLTAVRVIDGVAPAFPFFALAGLAAVLHPAVPVIGSGLILMVLVLPRLRHREQVWALSRLLIAASIVGLIAVYVLRAIGPGGLSYYLLPLTASGSKQLNLLSSGHLFDLLNWLLLTALCAPVLLALASSGRGVAATLGMSRRRTLAIWSMVPALLFVLIFIPHLGGPRDWDLFGLAVWLLLPCSVLLVLDRRDRRLPWPVIPASVVSLLTAVSFIAVNASVVAGTDRCEEVVKLARYKNLFQEYKALYSFASQHPAVAKGSLRYALEAWRQPPHNRNDSVYILGALAELYIGRGEREEARRYLTLGLRTDSLDVNLELRQFYYLTRFGTDEEILELADRLEPRCADNSLGLMNVGVAFIRHGQTKRGGADLSRAFELDSTSGIIVSNYATYQYQLGNYGRCVELFDRLRRTGQPTFVGEYYSAAALTRLGQTARARRHLARAAGLASSRAQKRLVEDLNRQMDGGP